MSIASSRPFRRAAPAARQGGFTLIEVLVAVVVVSIGLLGAGLTLVIVNRSNAGSYLQQSASQDMGSLLEAMRANPAGVLAGNYDGTILGTSSTTLPSCSGTPSCSPAQIATYDQAKLARALQSLPGGSVKVSTSNLGNGYVTVNLFVQWQPLAAPSGSGATQSAVPQSMTLSETL